MMPDKVFVTPHWYKVKKEIGLAAIADAVGVCGEDTQEILIDDKLGAGIERETVLHESMHALWHQTELDRKYKDTDEEAVIWSLAPRILALIKDNPELIAYLVEEV